MKTKEGAKTAEAAEAQTEVALKDKKAKNKKRDEKNLDASRKAISREKDLMYNYPSETDDLATRKKFRAAARRKKASYEKEIQKSKPEEREALINEANKWAKETYAKGHIPVFEYHKKKKVKEAAVEAE